MRKTIHLVFGNSVYDDCNKGLIPFQKGIYIAYSGRFDGKKVNMNRLLYIGMADDTTIAQRIHDHTVNQHAEWIANFCEKGENIFYRVSNIESNIREVEANLIFRLQPPCNRQDKAIFNCLSPAPNIITDKEIHIDGEETDILSRMA